MGAGNGEQQRWGPSPVPSSVQLCLLQEGPEGLAFTVNDAEGVSLTWTCVSPPGTLTPLGGAWDAAGGNSQVCGGCWPGTTLSGEDGKTEGVEMTLVVAEGPY